MTSAEPADTGRLLTEIRELVIAWRRTQPADPPQDPPGQPGGQLAGRVAELRAERPASGPVLATGDGFAARFDALDAALSAGAHLPAPWAQAIPEPAPLPEDAPPPLQSAAAEVEAALAAYRAAETAKTTAAAGLDDAGKALGDARLRFLELARRADLERP